MQPPPRVSRATRIAAGRDKLGRLAALARFFRDKDAPLSGKLFVIATIVYVICPIDFIPDVAPVIGWLDDLGLAGAALVYLSRVTEKYRAVAAEPVTVDAHGTSEPWPAPDAYAPAAVVRR